MTALEIGITKNQLKTDVIFRSNLMVRRRIHYALKGESKTSSTGDIVGIDFETYKNGLNFKRVPR